MNGDPATTTQLNGRQVKSRHIPLWAWGLLLLAGELASIVYSFGMLYFPFPIGLRSVRGTLLLSVDVPWAVAGVRLVLAGLRLEVAALVTPRRQR